MHAPKTRGALSPAAQLLRSSRVFSLPKPLPKPQPQFGQYTSDTATLPYPVHQAIATPPSSLARGDWGLKRALPLRATTRTSTPVFRVSHIDTIEHITEFESAADHVLTLQKWQEMNLAICNESDSDKHVVSETMKPKLNAFEPEFDNTAENSADAGRSTGRKRWKYRGPPVDTMSEIEFNEYLAVVLKRERPQFNQYLRERLREKIISDKQSYCRDRGQKFDSAEAEPVEEEYTKEHKRLREDLAANADNSELSRIVMDFLDLSPIPQLTGYARDMDAKQSGAYIDTNDITARTTHPSAGLSYLRSHAYLENHPVLGPQASRSPVEARVITPRVMSRKSDGQALLGVGGIVTRETGTSQYRTVSKDAVDHSGVSRFNPDAEGGSKVWVEPESGIISRDGRIKLVVKYADRKAAEIKQGRLPVDDRPQQKYGGRGSRRLNIPLDAGRARGARLGGYGIEKSNQNSSVLDGLRNKQ